MAERRTKKQEQEGVRGKDKKPRARRSTVLPAPPDQVQTPYANSHPAWRGAGLGEKVRVILDSPAWQAVMVPVLQQLDAERSNKGPAPAYTSEELERAVLFQKFAGVSTYREARNLLAGDRQAETRRLLGFDKSRKRYGLGLTLVRSLDGVPSEVTIWRHLQRWGLERQIAAYQRLFQALLEEHLGDPDFQAEARVLNIDGSTVRSHYTSHRRLDAKTGELLPPTLDGGGFMPRTRDNHGSDGHGFTMVTVTTSTGLPLASRFVPLATKDQTEPSVALSIFRDHWPEKVRPYLSDELAVLTADAAYSNRKLRALLHEQGIVEVCHPISHADRLRSRRRAATAEETRWPIVKHPNWTANGHRELECACGEGRTQPRISKDRHGRAIVRLEGQCKSCGGISITSGRWRTAENPRRFTRCQDQQEAIEQADMTFGNPLTFNDPLARQFGRARFAHGEGFHGALVTRFGLLKHKAWYRRREQAERDFLIVFCGMHALAIEQRARARKQAGAGTGGKASPAASRSSSKPPAPVKRSEKAA